MRRLLRPKLVFWLWTSVCIMAYFWTVKALDLTSVVRRLVQAFLFFLLMKLPSLSCIYSAGRGKIFSTLLISLALLFFFFFLSFLGRLRTLGTWRCYCTSDFRFFRLRVFHGTALTLGNGGVGWLVALGTVLIHFFSAGAKKKSLLSLGVNGLLDHLMEAF